MVVTAGITSPTLRVVKVADGTDLIPTTAMTEVAALQWFRYNAVTTARTVSGVAYLAMVTATIDGSVRVWDQPVGRDSA